MARFGPFLLAVFLTLGLSTAAVPTVRAEAAEKKEEAEKKPDILSPRFDLTLWTIVVFVLLLLTLRKWAWGPILTGLRSREDNIRKALEDAEAAKRETAELRVKLQGEMDKANEKSTQAVIEEGHRDASTNG